MEYVNLGVTGMKVSRLALGMMTYGAKSWREWILEWDEAKPLIAAQWRPASRSSTLRTSTRLGPARRLPGER